MQTVAKSIAGFSRAVRQSIPRDPESRKRFWNDTRWRFRINWKAVNADLANALSWVRSTLRTVFVTNVPGPATSAELIARINRIYPEAGDSAGQFLSLCVNRKLVAEFVSIHRFKRFLGITFTFADVCSRNIRTSSNG
jgi:hypothetical protein